MKIKKCFRCGKTIIKGIGNYCSNACYVRIKFGKGICEMCGKEYEKTGKNNRTCGTKCGNNLPERKQDLEFEYFSIRSDLKAQTRLVTVKCGTCDKLIEKRVGDHRRNLKEKGHSFCSVLCANKKSGRTMQLECDTCGKSFTRGYSGYSKYNEKGGKTFCSRGCQDKNIDYILRGKDHYNYVDGKSTNNRGKGWKSIRKEVRKRDKYTCQRCGKTQKELNRALDVHHIKPFRDFECHEEANNLSNLISYCASCHHKVEQAYAKTL